MPQQTACPDPFESAFGPRVGARPGASIHDLLETLEESAQDTFVFT